MFTLLKMRKNSFKIIFILVLAIKISFLKKVGFFKLICYLHVSQNHIKYLKIRIINFLRSNINRLNF